VQEAAPVLPELDAGVEAAWSDEALDDAGAPGGDADSHDASFDDAAN
jgi:hypothetical protein